MSDPTPALRAELPAGAVEDVYRLSPGQEGILFHALYAPDSRAYLSRFSLTLAGRPDVEALRAAWQGALDRHPALRASFAWEGAAEPLQTVRRGVALPWRTLDWSHLPAAEREARRDEFLRADAERGFDPASPPLMRVALLRTGEEEWEMVWTHHHLLLDGWSVPLVLRDVLALYAAGADGRAAAPAAPPVHREYVAWLGERDPASSEAFWRAALEGFASPTPIAAGSPPAGAWREPGHGRAEHRLPAVATAALRSLARREGITPGSVVQGAWALLLSRCSGEDDVVFGVAVSGRPAELPGVEEAVGMFVNTLPLRVRVRPDAPAAEWLRGVQASQLGLRAHEHTPLVRVQGWSEVPAGVPLFESLLAFENFPVREALDDGARGFEVEGWESTGDTHYPLTLLAVPEARLALRLQYDRARFAAAAAARIPGHLAALLEGIAADPARPLSELPMLGAAERERVLAEWNRTDADLPAACVHELFRAQAARTPGAAAVACEGASLTYAELDEASDRLARHLAGLGVGPETRVGVCMERSVELMVALLGTLKAGGAYVPLDPSYPADRLAYMLADAAVPVLLTQRRLAARVPEHGAAVVLVDGGAEFPAAGSAPRAPSPDNLAYVIYTSGSTGRPKGVMNSHRGIANRLLWMVGEYGLDASETVMQKTPFSFDVSVWELFAPLVCGARLVLARADGHRDPAYLAGLAGRERVTTLHFVPPMLHAFLEEPRLEERCASLRRVMCSGEALPYELQERFLARLPGVELHNLYGPTEAAVEVSYQRCRPRADRVVPIGRPLANTRLYVVDPGLQPLPPGVAGELLIGGVQVARGYLGRPGLTAEKFVPDPFSPLPGARVYRTGDRARWLEDGTVEFLGRIDQQVKVRGFRVEPAEVEAALLDHPGIREAVVVAGGAPGDTRLVGYFAPAESGPDAAAVRAHLAERLPEHMVPAALVPLDALPLSPNGKVDRRALPVPGAAPAPEAYVSPRTAAEELLAAAWSTVLGVDRVGARDSFFELGGHSLLAMQVVSRVRETFGVELPLAAVFEARTLAELAARVEAALAGGGRTPLPPVARAPRGGALPLSFAQQRLWFLWQVDPASSAYVMPGALRLRGPLDAAVLRRSLGEVVRRHEALRTVFPAVEGRAVQVVQGPAPVPLPVVDLRGLEPAAREAEARRLASESAARPFDLERGPLLRASLLRLDREAALLLFAMHHAVGDGWSTGILVRETSELYRAFARGEPSPLAELPAQYGDYAAWQRRWLTDEVLEGELAFWREAMAGAPPLLELPLDRPRPAVPDARGARRALEIPADAAAGVRELCRTEAVTPFMVLLAAWQLLLARYAGEEDVVVGTPVAGRTRTELEGLVGLFVNTLPLRADLAGRPSFRELLRRTRRRTLAAFAHQDLPFERLVDELGVERSLSHAPLFQALFVFAAAAPPAPALGDARVEEWDGGGEGAKFDLALEVADAGAGFGGALAYRTALFDPETAARTASHFATLLAAAAAAPEGSAWELPILGAAEREALVSGWNGTPAEHAGSGCVHELFEAQAARTPGAVALVADGERVTYAELDGRASALAARLRGLGVGPEVRVGVCAERTPELVVAVLATLKAGGAYVPLDPAYPAERLRFLVEDAAVRLVLTTAALRDRVPPAAEPVLVEDAAPLSRTLPLPRPPSPGGLAYVVHTSGSTGTPKGVMVEHRGFASLLLAARALFGFGPGDVVPGLASHAFDIWGFEVLGPLVCGAAVRLVPAGRLADPAGLAEEAARATVLHAVPALMRQVAASESPAPRLRLALTGGDTVPPELLAEVRERFPRAEVAVLYGPTEGTVLASVHRVPAGGRTTGHPIGSPLPGVRLYVCDAALEPAPLGVAGELLIGGAGVARGYLGRPGTTAEKWVPDPFSGEAGARLYRTGDRVRRRADGTLEFLGRTDGQVKVRGFRIEPGEIEAALAGHPSVREAVVTVREDVPGTRRLVAYVTPAGGEARPDADGLRAHLRGRLPEHMVPSAVVVLGGLPLNPNGKVDRRALPAPEAPAAAAGAYAPPRSSAEEVLARVWAELLGRERVGTDEDFFEAGGDSILVIQMVARARKEGVEVTPRQLFEHPTVAALARVAGVPAGGAPDEAAAPGEVPLTPVQLRFFEEEVPDRHHYNQSLLLAPRERLDAAVLERALARVAAHHDALRLRFVRRDGAWTQRYAEAAGEAALERVDLAAAAARERPALLEAAAAEIQAGLDLERGPLLRAALFQLGGGEQRLLLVMHHLAVDGVSWRVLGEDLQDAYRALRGGAEPVLPPKTASYRSWAERLREHAGSAALREEAEHWTSLELHDLAPIPVDLPGGTCEVASAAEVEVALDPDETRALLHDVPAAYRTRIEDVLLTALARALGDWTGERRVAVEVESHGRDDLFPGTDVTRTVGWFTSVYPVVLDLRGAFGEGEELKAVKEQLRGVPHHGIGFGVLRHLAPDAEVRRRLRALPSPGVVFNYLGQFDAPLSGALFALAGESTGPERAGAGRRSHLLDVSALVQDGTLRVRWGYGRRLHRPETIARLAARHLADLRALIAHCVSGDAGGYTPSDFPLAELDEATLAALEEDFL